MIAHYLPQFHPIVENDEWWGAGFTEWTNVAKARPLFRGHEQPKLPGQLGFYDLRLAETPRRKPLSPSVTASKRFATGIIGLRAGACSNDRSGKCSTAAVRVLEFCLGWANQHWTTIWTGGRSILVEQTYPGEEDHERHFRELLPAFRDERYFRVDGRPLFLVYRPNDMPEVAIRGPMAAARPRRRIAGHVPRRRGEERLARRGSGFRR